MAVSTKARANGAVPRTVAAAPPPTGSGPGRRRRPLWAVVGVTVVVVCGAVGALVAGAVDHRRPVVVVTHTVQPGQTITAGDLGFAKVAGPGLATVSDPAAVIGKVSSGRLPAGSPVVPGELNTASPADVNAVELPMALKAGMFPPGLAVGDQVLLVATTPASALSAGSPVTAPVPVAARVASVVADKSFGSTASTTVTVTVDRAALPGLANAAAAGQVLLAKVGS